MAEFAQSHEMEKITSLTEEFFKNVLYDEESLFISDEANLWDLSMSSVDDVLDRIHRYYGVSITREDSKQPFWKLILRINKDRK